MFVRGLADDASVTAETIQGEKDSKESLQSGRKRKTDRQTDRQTDRRTERQMDRQTDRQTENRQTDRQTDKQTGGCPHVNVVASFFDECLGETEKEKNLSVPDCVCNGGGAEKKVGGDEIE